MSNFIGRFLADILTGRSRREDLESDPLRTGNERALGGIRAAVLTLSKEDEAKLRAEFGKLRGIVNIEPGIDLTDEFFRGLDDEASFEAHARQVSAHPGLSAGYGMHPIPPLPTADIYETFAEDVKKFSAMTRQVGGDHYRTTKMQPFTFTLANGWDGAAHTILKYVARHEGKGGLEDLDKAIHVVDIRHEHMPKDHMGRCLPMPWADNHINMLTYCRVNGYEGTKMDALMTLESWVHNPGTPEMHEYVKTAIAVHRADVY